MNEILRLSNLSKKYFSVSKKITVINDGKTKFGLDSTIIDVTKNKINILRNGYINKKKLKNLIN